MFSGENNVDYINNKDIKKDKIKEEIKNTIDSKHHEGNDCGKDSFDKDGYDKSGFNKEGYDEEGYNRRGYNKDGYDKNGCNRNGECKTYSDVTSDKSVVKTLENIGEELSSGVADSQEEISSYYNYSNSLM